MKNQLENYEIKKKVEQIDGTTEKITRVFLGWPNLPSGNIIPSSMQKDDTKNNQENSSNKKKFS